MFSRGLILFLVVTNIADAARVLGVLPTPARSHSRVFESLLHELVARGHHVTYASAVPLQLQSNGTLNFIPLDDGSIIRDHMDVVLNPDRRPITEMWMLWKVAPSLCENELSSPQIRNLLSNGNFDLVIVEAFFFECMMPFAWYFKAPLITLSTQWPLSWYQAQHGNSNLPSMYPHVFLPLRDKMDFLERAYNTLFSALMLAARRWIYLPRQDAVVQRVFGKHTPSLAQLENNVSLMLTNTHPLLNYPYANVPAVVEVGGLHIKPVRQLPQELREFLDAAHEGVVLLSLGSLITSENVAASRLHVVVTAIKSLPYKVLWHYDTRDVADLPSNVRIETWVPQRDVLAHPNVKLLVTHGGLLSAQEATLEGVPRLVMPFFSDQNMNAWRAVDLEVAIAINFYKMKPQQLVSAITELVTQPKYRENAQRLSKILRDQPQSPLDRAVFWTEYVLRHNGAPHLRSAATQLSWYQLYLLDVAAAILVILILLLLVITFVFKAFCFFGRNNVETLDKKNK